MSACPAPYGGRATGHSWWFSPSSPKAAIGDTQGVWSEAPENPEDRRGSGSDFISLMGVPGAGHTKAAGCRLETGY